MRKRILSLLLALTLALSAGVFGVIPALAADSCVSVKADAVTTGEVVAGSLLEIKLSDVFEDTDGHTLTYTLTNAAQFSAQTKVKDGSLYDTFIQVSVWSVYFYLHICYCFLLLSRSQIKSSIAVDEVIDGCISQKSICLYLWIKSQK